MGDRILKYGVRDEKTVERMDKTLRIWMENPYYNLNQIAEEAKISRQTFLDYRRNPEFMEEYNKLCRARFEAIQVKAVEKLNELVDGGDFKAVKYALDGAGYAAEQKLSVKSDTVISIVLKDEQEEE